MDPNEQPPSMPDAPDKEKMEQVRFALSNCFHGLLRRLGSSQPNRTNDF